MSLEHWGLNVGKRLPDSEFLKEIKIKDGKGWRRGFQVTEPSIGWEALIYGRVCAGQVIVEEQQPSGFYTEMRVHESQIERR